MEKRTSCDHFEKKLRQSVENLKISSDFAACESPSSSTGSPLNSCNDASPTLQLHEGGFKAGSSSTAMREKRRHRAAGKQRQQRRRSFNCPTRIIPATESNFSDLVHQHTCQLLPDPPSPDLAAKPTSPRTTHSSISTSSTWSLVSSPPSPLSLHSNSSSSWDLISSMSSPNTPRSMSSNFSSPVSSPRCHSEAYMLTMGADQEPPCEVHAEHGPQVNAHHPNGAFEWDTEHAPCFTTCDSCPRAFWHLNPTSAQASTLQHSTHVPQYIFTTALEQDDSIRCSNEGPQEASLAVFSSLPSFNRWQGCAVQNHKGL